MCSICDGKVTVRVYTAAYPVWHLSEADLGTEIEMTQEEMGEYRSVNERWGKMQQLIDDRAGAAMRAEEE